MVSALDAAEMYGLKVTKHHKALCPWHNDHKPSLSFKDNYCKCFVCGNGGGSVSLTMQLLGLSAFDAAKRLNDDFKLGLAIDRAPTPSENAEIKRRRHVNAVSEKYEAWRGDMLLRLNQAFRVGHFARNKAPDEMSAAEALAVQWREAIEAWSDALDYGTMPEQMEILRMRGGIERLCNKILSDTQPTLKSA